MEILDVLTSKTFLETEEPISIRFRVIGGEDKGFFFPFHNESLTEPRIQFVNEEGG